MKTFFDWMASSRYYTEDTTTGMPINPNQQKAPVYQEQKAPKKNPRPRPQDNLTKVERESVEELMRQMVDNSDDDNDYNEDDDSEACLFWNHESKSANWWLCIDLQDSKLGILVHELFHATHRILEYFGVEFTSKNHEPFAYLIEYLYNECIEIKKGIGFTGESSYIKV